MPLQCSSSVRHSSLRRRPQRQSSALGSSTAQALPHILETVIIRDDRIVAVSDRAEIPAGARIIDATGQTLMPGLFDLHTHLNASGTDAVDDFGKSLKAYLVCGVTSVNDYSVYGEMLAPLRSLAK